MRVRNTTDRAEVAGIYRWSLEQAAAGLVEQVPNADGSSPWHNSLFRSPMSGMEWVVYLADQAWPGEVRVIAASAAT